MKFTTDIFKGGSSFMIGAAAVLVAPVILPVITAAVKPIAKAAIKSGFIVYEQVMLMAAEAKENVEDLAAEAKSGISNLAEEAKAEIAVKSS
ncbi:DUF5132 domain-containing protein [Candidatus Magnetomoraceae bacterium gMMP-15]